MGIGPRIAIPMVLQQAGINKDDVDLFEISEAFTRTYVYCVRMLGLDINKVNVNGGAIALGHPLGATGARQLARDGSSGEVGEPWSLGLGVKNLAHRQFNTVSTTSPSIN